MGGTQQNNTGAFHERDEKSCAMGCGHSKLIVDSPQRVPLLVAQFVTLFAAGLLPYHD
jgi:hypothetical protein